VVEGPWVGDRCFTSLTLEAMLRLNNLRLGGALRWLYPPPVLIKERWVGPCEQVLNVPITCWYMGPVSRCSCVTIWSKPLSPMLRRSWGKKDEVTQGDGRTSLSMVAKISSGVGACFDLVGTTWNVAMRWPCEIRMVWDHTWTERVACWLGFPYRVYIDLNHRDSRIWVTACLLPSERR
jgi:hypothetical protein